MYDTPPGYGIKTNSIEDKTYVLFMHKYIVSKWAGNKKWFRGVDNNAKEKATKWIWKFYDGFHVGYEVED